MKTVRRLRVCFAMSALVLGTTALAQENAHGVDFVPLFPKDGIPEGWVVRAWNDVSQPPGNSAVWRVENGVLRGGEPRGTWLMSEKQYTNFILEYEFKLGETGNSGLALRAPTTTRKRKIPN